MEDLIRMRGKRAGIYRDLKKLQAEAQKSGRISDSNHNEFQKLVMDYDMIDREIKAEEYEENGGFQLIEKTKNEEKYLTSTKGEKVRVYGKGEKIRKAPLLVGLDEYVSAMAFGPKNDLQERALSTASGQTLSTEYASEVIDQIRAKSAAFQAGAQTVTIGADSRKYTKITADATASWTAEAGSIGLTDPTLTTLSLNSEALLTDIKFSQQADQDSVNLGQALVTQAVNGFAVKLDNAAFEGSGVSPIPEGIFNYTSVNSINMSAGDQVGKFSAVGYYPFLDAQYELGTNNEFDISAIVMSPRSFRDLSDLSDTVGQPLQKPPAIASIPVIRTGSGVISDTRQLAASGSECSTIYMGNFNRLWFVSRLEFGFQILKERHSSTWELGFLGYLRSNWYPTHEQAFAKIVGVLPEDSVNT
jgi:HK97 family phage major capsid protein